MDIDVVGACANTSDAGANCETGALGLSTVVSGSDGACSCARWFMERERETTAKVCCDMMRAHEQCGLVGWRILFDNTSTAIS